MKRRPFLILTMAAIKLFALGQSVFAFNDVSKHPNGAKINKLKEFGIVNGFPKDQTFNPDGKLTYAAGISLIVKALDLNINDVQFIRMSQASDNFPNLEDDAWYSQAFVIAHFYGLDVPADVKEKDAMTKEQFAHHLFKSMMTKGDYAFIKMYIQVNDEGDINSEYSHSIQKLLISKIATLDKDNNFNPKEFITRGTAAGWVYDALVFVKKHKPIEPLPELPNQPEQPLYELDLKVESVTSQINKVTVTAQVPHPGYGMRISSIVFEGEQAIINVEAIYPDPDRMYPMVISNVSVSTYVDAEYKPVLKSSLDTSKPDAALGK